VFKSKLRGILGNRHMENEDMVSEEKLMRKLSLDWGISPYFLGNWRLKAN
jgi:hypothetical protein